MASKKKSEDVSLVISDDFELPPLTVEPAPIGSLALWIVIHILLLPMWACLLLPLLCSFVTVNPQEEILVLFFGKLNHVYKKSGIYNYSFVGRTLITISTKTQTIDIKKTTVVDANGNPIIVSGIATFKVVDSIKAAFGVDNVNDYMNRQAMATLKKVCSKYPYESKDGVSLQTEADQVSKEMTDALQKKAAICGVKVLSYELADLQYAPEIAQGMLVRQQAQALLDARKVIVEGAASIVTSTVHRLAEAGVALNDKDQARLVSNLLAVICSESRVQPMFSISETVENESNSQETNIAILKTLQQLNTNMTLGRPKQ